MGFRDLDEFLVAEPIVLPIRGKKYSFPGPGDVSADLWLRLQKLSNQMQQAQAAVLRGEVYDPDEEVMSDADQEAMMNEMFGGVEQDMIDDGLSSAHIKAVFYTLIAWHLSGEEAAQAVWDAQGEAPAPNRETRRASAKSTRPRGSRDGLTGPKPRKVVEASPGDTSSNGGT